jgi:CheY-like chemotaxis protein
METPLRILVAEDEMGDVLLLQRAFDKAQVRTPVHFARDGREVMDYLEGNPPFQNPVLHPLPTLLLLDLNLPFIDGFQVLEWVRLQPGLRHMIVVVFTNSEQQEDISRAYSLGANSYVVKPQDPNQLVQVVEHLQNYWFAINNFDASTLQRFNASTACPP